MIQELLKEKGHLSVSALTVFELVELLNAYRDEITNQKDLNGIEKKDNHLLSMDAVQKSLGISRTTFYRMRQKGLPEYVVHGKSKFNLNEVKKALKINDR